MEFGWSTREHTIEPRSIFDETLECAYCGAPIDGDENGYDHVDPIDYRHGEE
jgi:hypothetical protein